MRAVLSILTVLPFCLLAACGSEVSLIDEVKDAISAGEDASGTADQGADQGTDQAANQGADQGTGQGAPPTGAAGEELPTCEADADCDATCPPDAITCACFDAHCVSACEQDSDCPALPDGSAAVCEPQESVCVPAQG